MQPPIEETLETLPARPQVRCLVIGMTDRLELVCPPPAFAGVFDEAAIARGAGGECWQDISGPIETRRGISSRSPEAPQFAAPLLSLECSTRLRQ
jgi:hypothetical protein